MVKQSISWLIFSIAIVLMILAGYGLDWTGFNGKTLWDWMELALIPVILFFLANYYSRMQRLEAQRVQHEEEQFNVLQTYIDKLQQFVIENKLTEHKQGEPIVNFARTITLSTLSRLDVDRKQKVIILLNTLELIQARKDGNVIISLFNADMRGLAGARYDFTGSDLGMSNLTEADIAGSSFAGADLWGADITDAAFYYCDFRATRLQVVSLKGVNFYQCDFDENTIMPNGVNWNAKMDLTKEFGALSNPPITKREERQVLRDAGIKPEKNQS